MATATIQKSNNSRRAATRGSVFESNGETVIACSLPFGPDEPVITGHEPEDRSAVAASDVSVSSNLSGFLPRLLDQLASSHEWLLGPPLSKQDRVNAHLVRGRDERHCFG